jgi:hypothetical protein
MRNKKNRDSFYGENLGKQTQMKGQYNKRDGDKSFW